MVELCLKLFPISNKLADSIVGVTMIRYHFPSSSTSNESKVSSKAFDWHFCWIAESEFAPCFKAVYERHGITFK